MFVTFLPLTGLALYTAVALSRHGSAWTARVGLASIALLLGSFHYAHAPAAFAHFQQTGQESRLLARRMKQAFPTLPAHSHLLFLDDPYPAHDWILTFVIRLLYNDPSLLVDRAKDGSGEVQLPPGTIVLAFRQGQLEANPPVSGALEWEPLQLSPAVVRPGDPYSVAAGTLRGAEVDVEYSSSATGVETSGRIERWCRLDEFGRARLLTPAGQAPGVIRIRRIRGAGGKWMRTDAALEIRGRATE
jgi:hypothetical protein